VTARAKIPSAREIMQTKLQTIRSDAEIEDAVRLLLAKGHSGAPIVDDAGRLLGVLSEYDCIRILTQAVAEGWPDGRVEHQMTTEVESVPPSEDIFSLSARFMRGRHRRLVVVENEKAIGLISRRDLLRALIAMEREIDRSHPQTTYELIEARRRALD